MSTRLLGHKHGIWLSVLTLVLLSLGYLIYLFLLGTHQPELPAVRKLPPPPKYGWFPSPHFSERPIGSTIDTIVIHATALSPLHRVIAYFLAPSSKVSAHFTISKSGKVVQHVKVKDEAWHAGPSKLPDGRTSANDFSIGIELVNENDGVDPYPESQVNALKNLIIDLTKTYPITSLYAHSEISDPPERKSDPKGFDIVGLRSWWNQEKSDVGARSKTH